MTFLLILDQRVRRRAAVSRPAQVSTGDLGAHSVPKSCIYFKFKGLKIIFINRNRKREVQIIEYRLVFTSLPQILVGGVPNWPGILINIINLFCFLPWVWFLNDICVLFVGTPDLWYSTMWRQMLLKTTTFILWLWFQNKVR